ncbi:MAG TPA: hypothetical protein VHC69_07465 [Polyangiaceae bacterium]|nr:hypothetical protein [Polyangiaceae bacterium]
MARRAPSRGRRRAARCGSLQARRRYAELLRQQTPLATRMYGVQVAERLFGARDK